MSTESPLIAADRFRGLLNIHKPSGITSRDALDLVARPLKRAKIKVRVGHAGTLDPLATGVLVLCVGSATRLIEYVQRMPKTYVVTIRLGAESDTLDADGTVSERVVEHAPERARVIEAIGRQVGEIEQAPPAFSALKVKGVRAYEIARSGESVSLESRTVRVDRIDVLSYEWPLLRAEIVCGGGTYIRSIARDVGEELGCGGLVQTLERTRIGSFSIEDAFDPRGTSIEEIANRLLPPTLALGEMPRASLSDENLPEILQGRAISLANLDAVGEIALLDGSGALVALADREETGVVRPSRVFLR